MKLKFNSEGGFAGLKRQFEGDSINMPEEMIAIIDKLISDKNPDKHIESDPKARDIMKYTFEIENKEDVLSFQFDDLNIPSFVRPLINYFFKNAKPW